MWSGLPNRYGFWLVPTHNSRSKLRLRRLIPVVPCINKAHVDWKCSAGLRAQAAALDWGMLSSSMTKSRLKNITSLPTYRFCAV